MAVATVLLYHAGFHWMVGGYLGVSTFFTLSGFLITSLLLSEHEKTARIDLPAFWERRFRRIMPASFLALLGVTVFGVFAADRYQLEHLRGDVLATLGYGVNWWFIVTRRGYADIFGSPSPVQHFWSLAIEEQFYLVLPLLTAALLAISRGSRRVFCVAIALLCGASLWQLLRLVPSDVPTARLYYGTDIRAAELLAGALLAVPLANRPPIRARWLQWTLTGLGLLGLAVSVGFWLYVGQDDIRLYTGGLTLYTLATTALLAAAVLPNGPVRGLLSLGPLRRLGLISYGVYLYHFPIYLWLSKEYTGLSSFSLLALRLGLTLAVAETSYRWLELPVRTGRLVHGRWRWAWPPAIGVAVALMIVGVTPRTAPPATALAVEKDKSPDPGGPDGLRIMVMGDSVAGGIGRGMDRWARKTGRARVLIFTVDGCGIASGGRQASRDARRRVQGCAAWLERWDRTVAKFRPSIVVVYTGGWDLLPRLIPGSAGVRGIGDPKYDRWLRLEYRRAVSVLSSHGAHIFWLSSLCLRRPKVGPAGVFDPTRIHRLNEIIRDLAESDPDHTTYVDLFSTVCPNGDFTGTIHGVEGARPDGIHFSPAGADWVARWMESRLQLQAGTAY